MNNSAIYTLLEELVEFLTDCQCKDADYFRGRCEKALEALDSDGLVAFEDDDWMD